jgi:hypothetical protein
MSAGLTVRKKFQIPPPLNNRQHRWTALAKSCGASLRQILPDAALDDSVRTFA